MGKAVESGWLGESIIGGGGLKDFGRMMNDGI